jgi:hypothetical protein
LMGCNGVSLICPRKDTSVKMNHGVKNAMVWKYSTISRTSFICPDQCTGCPPKKVPSIEMWSFLLNVR